MGGRLARLANRADTSFDEHHTLVSDLPTMIGRGEPHAPNVRRSDFSDPKLEMNLVFDSLRVTTAIRCKLLTH